MKAIVVYQSLWGNTAAVARAIAEGIGAQAIALSTAQATTEIVRGIDLLVVGSPVLGFALPNDKMLAGIRANPGLAPAPPDTSQPSMRSWFDGITPGSGRFAVFETRVKGPFGKATPAITEALEKLGYVSIVPAQQFVVNGKYGPLRTGEIEKARKWGEELARLMGTSP